ncbi:MAG: heavy metal-binding domain-containing protein [Pirellulaceae bacterium]|nr:heavy metal-binding domain-containing protein [Pirellulaceae bacterium]
MHPFILFELGLAFGVPMALLLLGLTLGRQIEKKHLADLDRREAATQKVLVTQTHAYTDPVPQHELVPSLVVSEVVISSDYLKTFLGTIKNLFGGEISSFQTLLERGRREALLRIKEQSLELGYNAVCCVQIDTVQIGGRDPARKKNIVVASLLATGTAYYREPTQI